MKPEGGSHECSAADDPADLDGRHHRRHVRVDARLRQPARARPRPPGRHLDRAVPGEGHRHLRARHRGRHHPPPRRRPRHRRARGAAPGQHDRRRPPRRRRTREGRGAGRSDRGAALPTGPGRAAVGHADPDDHHDRRRPDDRRPSPGATTTAAARRRRRARRRRSRVRGAGARTIADRADRGDASRAGDDGPARHDTDDGRRCDRRRPRPARRPRRRSRRRNRASRAPTCSRRAANVPEAEVWLPGRPVDGGDPASCFLLGPTILTGRNISNGRGALRHEHRGVRHRHHVQERRLRAEGRRAVRQPAGRDRARRCRAVGADDQPGHHRPQRADLG